MHHKMGRMGEISAIQSVLGPEGSRAPVIACISKAIARIWNITSAFGMLTYKNDLLIYKTCIVR